MENASSKPMRVVLSAKKRGMRSFSARSRASCALLPPNAKRESASRCSRFPRSSECLLTGLFRKAQPSELWDLEEHLTRRRKEITYKYDSRGSRLTHVLGKLLYEGRLEEEQLRGLSQHQLNAIRSYKDFLRKHRARAHASCPRQTRRNLELERYRMFSKPIVIWGSESLLNDCEEVLLCEAHHRFDGANIWVAVWNTGMVAKM